MQNKSSILLSDIIKQLVAIFIFPIAFLILVQIVTFERVISLQIYLQWVGFMIINSIIIIPIIKSNKTNCFVKMCIILAILLMVPTRNSIFPISVNGIVNKLFEYFVVIFYSVASNFNEFLNKENKINKYNLFN